MPHDSTLLETLAAKVGTPFWLYDAATIRQRIADIRFMSQAPNVQARFAMKGQVLVFFLSIHRPI